MKKRRKHTISVLVENKFGVLARVAGLFSGRGFNIDTLNVGPTHDPRFSKITATLWDDGRNPLDQCVKQLDKLINVIEIKDFSRRESFVARELVMLKVSANENTRSKIIEIANIFRVKIVSVSPESIITECTGTENKIAAFLELISPYGILEIARTGNVALERGIQSARETEEAVEK